MDLPRIRPRVFLSHSKSDISFVQQLYDDLRHCQIDPWLDSEEIRHGQPWLDAIFESGIPTCDCVLVYLSTASIESPMVKKEIDASIIQKLRDNRVAFLPYICDSALRRLLRVDIQTIQIPEWNTANYSILLPRVVAEIWHSFMVLCFYDNPDGGRTREGACAGTHEKQRRAGAWQFASRAL